MASAPGELLFQGEKLNAASSFVYKLLDTQRGNRFFHVNEFVAPETEGEQPVYELDHTYLVTQAISQCCDNLLPNNQELELRYKNENDVIASKTYSKQQLTELGKISGLFHDLNYTASLTQTPELWQEITEKYDIDENEKGEILSAAIAEKWMSENGFDFADTQIVKEAILATIVFPPDYKFMSSEERVTAINSNPLAFFAASADLLGAVVDPPYGTFAMYNNMFRIESGTTDDIPTFVDKQATFLGKQLEIYRQGYESNLASGNIIDPENIFQASLERAEQRITDRQSWIDELTRLDKEVSSEPIEEQRRIYRSMVLPTPLK